MTVFAVRSFNSILIVVHLSAVILESIHIGNSFCQVYVGFRYSLERQHCSSHGNKCGISISYDEMHSAINILRFVLLIIIYTTVGISHNSIIKCKRSYTFKGLDDDAEIILRYSKKGK